MTGVDGHAAGIADSLGAYLRKTSADEESLQTVEGEAWDMDICIRVKTCVLCFGSGDRLWQCLEQRLEELYLAVVFRGGIREPDSKAEEDAPENHDRRQDDL
ncbi:hypothetical protein AC579_6317 [Pseudocercospora musae]|uniref:Uncharacterized protein n=1 Tax=Pseudocercospora musae TaxID=113226 RepID=A0A139IPE8_9PEZI|nr:hypothetical protein AC579_6317 [Pseudocercospora musae]